MGNITWRIFFRSGREWDGEKIQEPKLKIQIKFKFQSLKRPMLNRARDFLILICLVLAPDSYRDWFLGI